MVESAKAVSAPFTLHCTGPFKQLRLRRREVDSVHLAERLHVLPERAVQLRRFAAMNMLGTIEGADPIVSFPCEARAAGDIGNLESATLGIPNLLHWKSRIYHIGSPEFATLTIDNPAQI